MTWKSVAECIGATGCSRSKIHGWVRYGLVKRRPSAHIRSDGRPDHIMVCVEEIADLMANPPKKGPKKGKKKASK